MPPRAASPPTGPHSAAEPLHRAALQLLRLVRREDAATGVSPARLSALSVLVFGGPCTLGALAAAEQVSAPTMSRIVADLEREGWIARHVDPDDARRATLEATPAARKLLREGRARRLRALTAGLDTLSPADQRAIRDAIPALEGLIRALATRRARPGGPRARRRFD